MKANELRIGNFVNKITTSDNDTDLTIVNAEDIFNVSADIDFYGPILLTEKWLLKFGLVEIGNNFSFWQNSIYSIEKTKNKWQILYQSNDIMLTIKYVHQLQNLYYALTGEELELQPS